MRRREPALSRGRPLQAFPEHLRSHRAYAAAMGIDDELEAFRAWQRDRREWLREHGYAVGPFGVDWARFNRDHPREPA